jgi:hypothetical protein
MHHGVYTALEEEENLKCFVLLAAAQLIARYFPE